MEQSESERDPFQNVIDEIRGAQIIEITLLLSKVCLKKCLGGYTGQFNKENGECISSSIE